ncbi:hypothetical protein ABER75_04265 [Niallia taxi]|uniref:hypothetical protein n=2 Tax=Niallia taxi TaxID=2499688 RepID=UPI002041EF7E|nr:hypothetical protein [Niallia taxi]MCM3218153.1 hypothetical protein [Niallia taxi]
MKKLLIISSFFLLGVTACSSNQATDIREDKDIKVEQSEKSNLSFKKREPRSTRIDITNKDGYQVSSAEASMVDSFESVEQLDQRSDLNIEGQVISNEYVTYDDIPFTISKVKIIDIIGKTEEGFVIGDTIKVVQTGGLYVQHDVGGDEKIFTTEEEKKESEKMEGKTIEVTLNDAPVIKKNNTVVLFLEKSEDDPLGSDLYAAVGDYQGKFIVESDDYIEPQSLEIKSKHGNSDFTMEEIEAEVKSAR